VAALGVDVLAIVEQPHRGVVERRYADSFYLARVLGAQLGHLDVVLRGAAVLLARRPEDSGRPHWDGGLPGLLSDGAGLYVEREDAARLGLSDDDLLDGVLPVDGSPKPWGTYHAVWFL
jgi:hypothetical protein